MEELKSPVRVLLVDDETLVRVGLRLILEGDPGISIVGECGDGRQALDAVSATAPDVVLMDIRMPVLDGLETCKVLLERDPGLRILMLTTFDADDMVIRALTSGAAGFLLKDTPPAELVAAVHQVASGRPMLSPSVTRQLIDALTRRAPDPGQAEARQRIARLTERESEIARAISEGMTNAEIAALHFISLSTVKTHIGRILEKLPADNRVQIALCLHAAGIG
ncbi:response regulator [Paeniglutamicibacter cryotolerans]|uniref:DNA-binding NarL/FixJ family response regulator n=1 Tax=Paeniglutamicibacter cryotolerans TaxID=670079 RepID=A0A839QNV4_9MICC|nr:response regulator transcription factor [Paeniglutamicibacter cryotolerans]MBB2994892.1 DNA-binding NarL/FixJ family response regulator [Paeniglutamicibacter cryotolerans]